jgi:hypothetical protein
MWMKFPYATEQDLEDILRSFKMYELLVMNTRIKFLRCSYCEEKGIALHFNYEIIVFRAVVFVKMLPKERKLIEYT